MKKKLEKKMVLNRETLRTLSGNQLDQVIGGVPPDDTDDESCGRTCSCECAPQ